VWEPDARGDTGGRPLKNIYASGWAATGAHGVLASTLLNANTVVDTILSDLFPGRNEETGPIAPPSIPLVEGLSDEKLNPDPDPEDCPREVTEGRRERMVTDYRDWKAVDEEEERRGLKIEKERERMGWEEAREFIHRN